jgi:hypothetical protein
LTTLYAHLPETDTFLAEVLRKAIESGRDQPPNDNPLHNLREAHLTSSWNYRADERARDDYRLDLNHLWPVFQLPNIQRLSVFDFESLGASNRFGNSTKTSRITDLTLVHYNDSLLAVPDTLALLALPKALTSLSIYWNDCDMLKRPSQPSNADLWNGIRQHEDSIEHLDIYRACTGCIPPQHSANNLHFGSMQGFKRLKRLYIQPEVLLGGCCLGDLAPFHLRDTLPRNLQSLTLYRDEGLALNKSLTRQLQDVIASTDFASLRHVALEKTFEQIDFYTDPADPPHEEVERACRERGTKYETKHASSCTKGGIGRRYYRHIKEQRLKLANLIKLGAVRYALTEYLSRLRLSRDDDGFSTADPRELSSDELDTYELPWDRLTREALYPEDESDLESGSGDPFSEDEAWEEFDDMDSQDLDSQERSSEDSKGDAEEYDGDSDGVW